MCGWSGYHYSAWVWWWRGFGGAVGLVVRWHGLVTACDFSAMGPVLGCGVEHADPSTEHGARRRFELRSKHGEKNADPSTPIFAPITPIHKISAPIHSDLRSVHSVQFFVGVRCLSSSSVRLRLRRLSSVSSIVCLRLRLRRRPGPSTLSHTQTQHSLTDPNADPTRKEKLVSRSSSAPVVFVFVGVQKFVDVVLCVAFLVAVRGR
ncbi:hypothetical protein SO802_029124 [Lithocarpus litseifolius]|uniref:Secreted protein n=1 Tax=Lithocarpus litseifolius TaxID=425828 RepID=A0AAW2BVE6_9ROSI